MDADKYRIFEKKNKTVIVLQLDSIIRDSPYVFADDIAKLLEQYKNKPVLIDASQLPENGIPRNGDFTKTRLDYLVTLTAEVPQLKLKTQKTIYNRWREYLPKFVKGTKNSYHISPAGCY